MKRWLVLLGGFAAVVGAVFACVSDATDPQGAVKWSNTSELLFSAACGANASSQTVMITNSGGSADWTVSLAKGASSPYMIDKQGGKLASGASDTITITPLAVGADASTDPNAYTDKLVLHSPPLTDATLDLRYQLTGAVLVVTPTTLDVGDQPYNGPSPGLPVTLKNAGTDTATFTVGTTPPWFASPTGDQTIAAGASFVTYVSVTPSAMGPTTAALSIQVKGATVLCGSVSSVPLKANGINGVVEVTAGGRAVCARRSNGTVACWGNDGWGQLGNGQSGGGINFNFGTPQEVWLPAPATNLGMGFRFSCAGLIPNGAACWGTNYLFESGGEVLSNARPEAGVLLSGPGSPFTLVAKQIRGSYFTGCLRDQGGSIWCWGDPSLFGVDPDAGTATPYPTGVPLGSSMQGWTDFIVNSANVCGTTAKGVQCWPNIVTDDAGMPTDASVWGAQPVRDLDGGVVNSVRLGAGDGHVCAVQSSGNVLCWGVNGGGQLGDGTATSNPRAVQVKMLDDALSVAGSGNHTCAVRRNGSVVCWGDNTEGQLGNGTTTSSLTPTQVSLTEPAVSVGSCTTGLCNFDCAITIAGHVWCWGANNYRQLGQGDDAGALPQSNVPIRVPGL